MMSHIVGYYASFPKRDLDRIDSLYGQKKIQIMTRLSYPYNINIAGNRFRNRSYRFNDFK